MIGIVTVLSGSALRSTVTVMEFPSATEWMEALKLTVTVGTSPSVMDTTVSSTVPSETPAGSVPKVSSTDSSSSSMLSSVALKVKDFSVSVAEKVTFGGTPE